jgi:hypothetical protein
MRGYNAGFDTCSNPYYQPRPQQPQPQAQTYFHFHIQYIALGYDAKFTVTNAATGYSLVHRTHVFPFISETTSFSWRTGFPEGSTVTGCMTNFSNRYESCYTSTVSAGAVDFYVSAR